MNIGDADRGMPFVFAYGLLNEGNKRKKKDNSNDSK